MKENKMQLYEKKSLIKCSTEALYAFHLDVKNLQKITPKDVKVKLLNVDFVPKEGEVLRLKTLKNFIPMLWEVRIEKMQEPNLLVDVALRSPFAFWKHSHIFSQVDENTCELKDIVEYSLPFGFFGKVFHYFVEHELQKMFMLRHTKTKDILEERI